MIIACENLLQGKKMNQVRPYNPYFTGEYIQDQENIKRWIIRGKIQIVNTTVVKIHELPPSMTFEKYESILDDLIEKKLIISYDDNCKDNIEYTIKFTRDQLSKYDEEKLIKLLRIEEYETEIYSTLDEEGKLKIFENIEDIFIYFVNFRLSYYDKRKQYLLDKLKYELKILSNKGRFIKSILESKIDLKNVPKDILIKNIDILGLDKIDDGYDYLLRMPIWSLTKEMFDKLKEDFKIKKDEMERLSLVDPRAMYLEDLSELKKKIKV